MSALLIIGLKNAILVIPLALIALTVGRWSRRPALSHLLWTLVLVKLLTPPLINVPVGWQIDVASWLQSGSHSDVVSNAPTPAPRSIPRHGRSGTVPRNNPLTVTTTSPPRSSQSSSSAQHASQPSVPGPARFETSPSFLAGSRFWAMKTEILLVVWLIGSLYVLIKLVWRSYQFHSFLRLVERRHESLGPRAAELAVRAGITIAPRVVVVDSVVSPMLWGMGRRACLVFPAKLISRLSPLEVDALLLHELAHFARGDHWVRVLELAVSVLYWWHPVFWWARHELEISEEQCCDAWVVEHQSGSRHSYAEALLATIDFLHEPAASRPPVACGLGEVPFLRTRLTQIMRGQVAARLPVSITTAVVIAGVLCSPLEPNLWANSSTARSMLDMVGRAMIPRPSARSADNQPALPNGSQSRNSTNQMQVASLTPRDLSNVNASSSGSQIPAIRPSRAPTLVWASAHSPNRQYHIEARVGSRVTLVSPNIRLDLTSHHITCVSFAPNSTTFATGHEDFIVRQFDSETGGMLQLQYKGCDSPITSIHISPDGSRLAAGTTSGSVVVWDMASADEIGRLERPGSAISCVRWAPHGNDLAISRGDWSEHEQSGLIVWSPAEDVVLYEQSLSQPVGALDWMGRDNTLLMVGWDGQSQVWSLATKQVVSELQLDKDQVSAAAWSADCLLLNQGIEIDSRLGSNP